MPVGSTAPRRLVCLRQGLHVVRSGLKLIMQQRITLNSWFFCLHLLRAGMIVGRHHHSWLDLAISKHHFHQLYTTLYLLQHLEFLHKIKLHFMHILLWKKLKSDRDQTLKLLHV